MRALVGRSRNRVATFPLQPVEYTTCAILTSGAASLRASLPPLTTGLYRVEVSLRCCAHVGGRKPLTKTEGDEWYAAACLAGEAGLRVGEIKALRWREDVDLIAKTITVNFQTRNKRTTTPKGRKRRTVPMTSTLHEALKRMSVIREGLVVRNLDGSAKTDDQADKAIQRICRRAGLPARLFHTLRHTFGTHAALFGVNPWRLQAWLGHKRIDETMIYVHVAEAHHCELPEIGRSRYRRSGRSR